MSRLYAPLEVPASSRLKYWLALMPASPQRTLYSLRLSPSSSV